MSFIELIPSQYGLLKKLNNKSIVSVPVGLGLLGWNINALGIPIKQFFFSKRPYLFNSFFY